MEAPTFDVRFDRAPALNAHKRDVNAWQHAHNPHTHGSEPYYAWAAEFYTDREKRRKASEEATR